MCFYLNKKHFSYDFDSFGCVAGRLYHIRNKKTIAAEKNRQLLHVNSVKFKGIELGVLHFEGEGNGLVFECRKVEVELLFVFVAV